MILRSSQEVCATAHNLYGTLAVLRDEAEMLRREADGLRGESVRLRRQAQDARAARQEGSGG